MGRAKAFWSVQGLGFRLRFVWLSLQCLGWWICSFLESSLSRRNPECPRAETQRSSQVFVTLSHSPIARRNNALNQKRSCTSLGFEV